MHDSANIWLSDAEKTHFAGVSLARSLYSENTTVCLEGELGAGKTTFLQGFLEGLGVQQNVTSPTYALEQRYAVKSEECRVKSEELKVKSDQSAEILHIDLYRLDEKQAEEFIASSHDHGGIRCIEWSDRLPKHPEDCILLQFEDPGDGGRTIDITFDDIPIPTATDVERFRQEVSLPDGIVRHCEAVGSFAERLAKQLLKNGHICRPLALKRAGEIHDLFRFVDFTAGAAHVEAKNTTEQEELWAEWKHQYSGLHHEEACSTFLEEEGFPEIATIVKTHGLSLPPETRVTMEQKVLFYADKRLMSDRVVSLDERFADFAKRYKDGKHAKEGDVWKKLAEEVESELFPEGIPQ